MPSGLRQVEFSRSIGNLERGTSSETEFSAGEQDWLAVLTG
jgi:hypothetical protein